VALFQPYAGRADCMHAQIRWWALTLEPCTGATCFMHSRALLPLQLHAQPCSPASLASCTAVLSCLPLLARRHALQASAPCMRRPSWMRLSWRRSPRRAACASTQAHSQWRCARSRAFAAVWHVVCVRLASICRRSILAGGSVPHPPPLSCL